MGKTRILASLAALALATTALSACVSSSSSDAKAQYEAKKSEIPQMVKRFSAPNMGVLLNKQKIGKVDPQVQSAEETGSTRLGEKQAAELLNAAQVSPAECRAKLLETYHDDTKIPAAYSQGISKDEQSVVRIQLRSHPGVKEAAAASAVQRKFIQACPQYTLTVSGTNRGNSPAPAQPQTDEVTNFTTSSEDYPLEGASDGLLTKVKAKAAGAKPDAEEGSLVAGESAGYTTVAVFQRIGNLELRVYFDGAHPEEDAKAAKEDLQRLVTHIGQAFVAKAK